MVRDGQPDSWFVMAGVAIVLATFVAWGLFGPEPSWLDGRINAVAVVIMACPCVPGLATPMSIMVATWRAATRGILFRDAAAIEHVRQVDTWIVDKTGTDVTMNSAPVTLVKRDLRGIAQAHLLSQATIADMRQNLGVAVVDNALGVPRAAGLLIPFPGWLLSPMIAALAMRLSSASVTANALRLRRATLLLG